MRKAFLAAAALVWAHAAEAQQPQFSTPPPSPSRARRTPGRVTQDLPGQIQLTVGDTIPLQATAYDAAGNPVPGVRILFNMQGREGVLVGSDRFGAPSPGSPSCGRSW